MTRWNKRGVTGENFNDLGGKPTTTYNQLRAHSPALNQTEAIKTSANVREKQRDQIISAGMESMVGLWI
jgi:hypothetical protein